LSEPALITAHDEPPLVLPRGLIFLASIWLVVSWAVAIGFRTPVEASSASYTPGVRLMLISAAIGLIIGWPLLRVSQSRAEYPLMQTLLDLIVLLALVQVVIWPLRLVTPWSPARTAALDATLVAWTVLAGALVASATGSPRTGPRNIAIIACVTMCLIGPVLALIGVRGSAMSGLTPRLLQIGPLLEVYALSQGGRTAPSGGQWAWISLVALAGATAWTGLITITLTRSRTNATRPPEPGA
jgi:hypothetical protein